MFTGDEVIISGGLIVKSGRITAVLRGDQADVEPVGEKDLVFDGASHAFVQHVGIGQGIALSS